MNDDNDQNGWSIPPYVPPKKWIGFAEWIAIICIFVLFVIGFLIGKSI